MLLLLLKNIKVEDFFFNRLCLPGLCCFVGFSLVAASGGYSLDAVCGPLMVVPSLLAEHLGYAGFSICVSWALEHRPDSCGTRA